MQQQRRARHSWSAVERERLKSAVQAAAGGFPDVVAVYLYGSAVEDGSIGDVDLGVVRRIGALAPRRADEGRLARAIADNYAGVLPELDIRDLTPSQHVLACVVFGRGNVLLYERDRASRASAEARIVEEHLDTQWLRDSYRRYRRRHDAA